MSSVISNNVDTGMWQITGSLKRSFKHSDVISQVKKGQKIIYIYKKRCQCLESYINSHIFDKTGNEKWKSYH